MPTRVCSTVAECETAIAAAEQAGEQIVTVVSYEGTLIVVTRPGRPSRPRRNWPPIETR